MILYSDPGGIENLISSNSHYIESCLTGTVYSGKNLENVSWNTAQGQKKKIYNLRFDDGSMAVIKLYTDRRKYREAKGLIYASKHNVPNPGLLYFEPSADNPLNNPYTIMGYVEAESLEDYMQGSYHVEGWAELNYVNPDSVKAHINGCASVLLGLHQGSKIGYFRENMEIIIRDFHSLIEKRMPEKDQAVLIEGLNEVHKAYSRKSSAFRNVPLAPRHGDPNPRNFLHTENGIVPVDWEDFGFDDPASDVAYFAERNFLIREDYAGELERMCELYSWNDPSFPDRLSIHHPLAVLWHVVHKGNPMEWFIDSIPKK